MLFFYNIKATALRNWIKGLNLEYEQYLLNTDYRFQTLSMITMHSCRKI